MGGGGGLCQKGILGEKNSSLFKMCVVCVCVSGKFFKNLNAR